MPRSKLSPSCRLAALGLATEGAVRTAPFMGLPQLLRGQGVDPDALIREQGCDPEVFADADNIIAFGAAGRMLAHAAARTGCRYPGLELGRHHGLGVVGAVGRAARWAPDVGSGLNCLTLHLHLHDRGSIPYLWTDGDQAMLGYTLHCAEITGTDHIYDGALAISHNMIRDLAGPTWRAAEVRLFRDPVDDPTPFYQHFQANLRFGAQQSAIVFPASDLRRPCVSADPERYASALRDLESLDATTGGGLRDKVLRLLLRLFVTGAGVTGKVPDRTAVAALFSLHPRTLNRRLRAEGTSFAALLSQARYDVARELLRDTRLPVDDIAFLLGYSETAAFIHAFRRWSGMTASQWRSPRNTG